MDFSPFTSSEGKEANVPTQPLRGKKPGQLPEMIFRDALENAFQKFCTKKRGVRHCLTGLGELWQSAPHPTALICLFLFILSGMSVLKS